MLTLSCSPPTVDTSLCRNTLSPKRFDKYSMFPPLPTRGYLVSFQPIFLGMPRKVPLNMVSSPASPFSPRRFVAFTSYPSSIAESSSRDVLLSPVPFSLSTPMPHLSLVFLGPPIIRESVNVSDPLVPSPSFLRLSMCSYSSIFSRQWNG